jgi:GDP-L-fucose synthase
MYNKVLITGGSGFLGKQLVPICKKNYKVLAPRSKTFDLYNYDKTLSYLKKHKPEVIIHGAAYYGGININVEEPANLFHHNTLMTTNLFEAAAQSGVKKVVSVGSACAYPGCIIGDMKEEDFWSGPMHDSVIGYGSSKKIQLIAQQSYHKQYGLEGNHLALTNLYGPHDVFTEYRSHVVPALIKRFSDERNKPQITNWGNGSAIREFIYVKDAAQAISEFIDQPHDLEPVNIGTGIGTSIKELAELTAKYMNFHGRLEWDTSKPNGVPRKVLDITRMKQKLPQFRPLSFEVGLKLTIDWYLKNKKEADARK